MTDADGDVPKSDPPIQLHMRRETGNLQELRVPPGYELAYWGRDRAEDLGKLLGEGGELGDWDASQARSLFTGSAQATEMCAVLERKGQGVATAQLVRHRADGYAPLVELGWVAVTPEQRGRRLGYWVCLAILWEAVNAGDSEIFLRTDDERLPAIRTYLRLGFEPWFVDGAGEERWRAVLAKLEHGKSAHSTGRRGGAETSGPKTPTKEK